MHKFRSIPLRTRPRLRAVWPLDHPETPPPMAPAERVVGKVNAYPLTVRIWPASARPADVPVAWHPYGGGCWVEFAIG